MTDTTASPDPAAIERDIRKTQEDMSRTVDRIGDQLTMRNVVNALFDKAERNDIDARGMFDHAKRNPLALAMIAGGAIWLISDSDAKLPSFGSDRREPERYDPHRRDYIAHMERVEPRDGEDALSYQRRRDIARANYFMVERGQDEDDTGFRQRLDDAAEAFRAQRQAWSEQADRAGQAIVDTGRSTLQRGEQLYADNPLIGGLVAAALGAVVGTAVPLTETEEEQLAGIGEKARDVAGEQKDKLVETARDKAEQLVEKVEEKARPQGQPAATPGGPSSQPEPSQPAARQFQPVG